MIIGIDFDNTIVCYDRLFHRIGVENGWVPQEIPSNKRDVRDYLRGLKQEDRWTELQGIAYGVRIRDAEPFPGVLEFLRQCRATGIEVHIISHKTLRPFAGPACNLHHAAHEFLQTHGFYDEGTGLDRNHVHLELTKQKKIDRIRHLKCNLFVDDLPEFLAEVDFPEEVTAVLFEPNRAHAKTRFRRVTSWQEVSSIAMAASDLAKKSERLIARAGFPADSRIHALSAGANNRVFMIESRNGRALLKSYFTHRADPRDRLGTEWAFSRFAWGAGMRSLPQPLFMDAKQNLALYAFIKGKRLAPDEVAPEHVRQALGFLFALNHHRDTQEARLLCTASEACFSIDDHLNLIRNRVERLECTCRGSSTPSEARAFVTETLQPTWTDVEETARREAKSCGMDPHALLSLQERCVSPSDFGFHNALVAPTGALRFLDFEYAGWDDPAKLICDFFLQPAVPAPHHCSAWFSAAIASLVPRPEQVLRRVELLWPAYCLKWCCILLNELLPEGRDRRSFAGRDSFEQRIGLQVAKARSMMAMVTLSQRPEARIAA